MIKGLIFDMDGTMVPDMPCHLAAFAEQVRQHGWKLRREINSDFYGWTCADIYREILEPDVFAKIDSVKLAAEKEEVFRQLYGPQAKFTDGLEELLIQAKEAGVKCYIGSAGPRANVEFMIDKVDAYRYMEGYVCLEDVTKCKPDPEIFLLSASRMDLDPKDCVVFEDGTPGLIAACRAGMSSVGVASSDPIEKLIQGGANFAIKDFVGLTLEKLIERLE